VKAIITTTDKSAYLTLCICAQCVYA